MKRIFCDDECWNLTGRAVILLLDDLGLKKIALFKCYVPFNKSNLAKAKGGDYAANVSRIPVPELGYIWQQMARLGCVLWGTCSPSACIEGFSPLGQAAID